MQKAVAAILPSVIQEREKFCVLDAVYKNLIDGSYFVVRASHPRTSCVIEDMGFILRDCILHFHNNNISYWYLFQKCFDKTYANNITTHNVGAINIDACRIDYESEDDKINATPQGNAQPYQVI